MKIVSISSHEGDNKCVQNIGGDNLLKSSHFGDRKRE